GCVDFFRPVRVELRSYGDDMALGDGYIRDERLAAGAIHNGAVSHYQINNLTHQPILTSMFRTERKPRLRTYTDARSQIKLPGYSLRDDYMQASFLPQMRVRL